MHESLERIQKTPLDFKHQSENYGKRPRFEQNKAAMHTPHVKNFN
jgi:hypothetical protein